MEALVRDGLVRSLGVSNFSAAKLAAIEAYAAVPPAVCQVEAHPYHRNDALLAWCATRGIHVTAFSPLGSPDSESIFPRRVPAVLMEDPVVRRVAASSGRNVGQVLVRWALQRGTSVIPKSTNPDRIRGNLDVLAWALRDDEACALAGLRFQQRMVNGALWLNPKGPYRTMEDLWDEPDAEPEGAPGELVAAAAAAAVAEGERAQTHGAGSHPVDASRGTLPSGATASSPAPLPAAAPQAGRRGAAAAAAPSKSGGRAGRGGKLSRWLGSKKGGD